MPATVHQLYYRFLLVNSDLGSTSSLVSMGSLIEGEIEKVSGVIYSPLWRWHLLVKIVASRPTAPIGSFLLWAFLKAGSCACHLIHGPEKHSKVWNALPQIPTMPARYCASFFRVKGASCIKLPLTLGWFLTYSWILGRGNFTEYLTPKSL